MKMNKNKHFLQTIEKPFIDECVSCGSLFLNSARPVKICSFCGGSKEKPHGMKRVLPLKIHRDINEYLVEDGTYFYVLQEGHKTMRTNKRKRVV